MILVIANDSTTTVKPNQNIDLVADRAEIDNVTGMSGGPVLVRIRANDEEGLGAFFAVRLAFNKQGRPVLEVSTEIGAQAVTCSADVIKTVSKSVTGVCTKL